MFSHLSSVSCWVFTALPTSLYSILKFKELVFHTENHAVCVLIHYRFPKQEASNQAKESYKTKKKTDKKIPEPDDVFHEKDNDVCGKKRYILAIRSVTGFKKAE